MKIPIDNPAGRVHSILVMALTVPADTPTPGAWSHLFGIPRDDTRVELAACLGNLSLQLVEAEKQARRMLVDEGGDPDNDQYMRCFSALATFVLSQNLEVKWGNNSVKLNERNILELSLWATKLSLVSNETEPDQEDLDKFLKEVAAFSEEVAKSDLAEEIKSFIVERLESIRSAVLDYRIRGSRALEEALERTIGGMVLRAERYNAERTENEATLKRFESILGNLERLARLFTKGKKLLTDGAKFLLPFIQDTQ